ncbi:hypothetical protein O6V51_22800, partial [Salmonella enterica subsp. enterica]
TRHTFVSLCPWPRRCPVGTNDGYLTPHNPHNQQHCIGASYHRGDESTVWREEDQRQNRQRLLDCFPDAKWAIEVDVSGNSARCGVRCASRDHLPMVG